MALHIYTCTVSGRRERVELSAARPLRLADYALADGAPRPAAARRASTAMLSSMLPLPVTAASLNNAEQA
eukprot:scaffold17545_cov94-Isochrysis_galbana.AAC.1